MCEFSLLDLLRATGAFAIVLGAIFLALKDKDFDQHLADADPAGGPEADSSWEPRA
jgi:hypothetical protein